MHRVPAPLLARPQVKNVVGRLQRLDERTVDGARLVSSRSPTLQRGFSNVVGANAAAVGGNEQIQYSEGQSDSAFAPQHRNGRSGLYNNTFQRYACWTASSFVPTSLIGQLDLLVGQRQRSHYHHQHHQVRGFHSSTRRSIGNSSYNEVIPPYYAARKARLDKEAGGKGEEAVEVDTAPRKDSEGHPLRLRKNSKSLYEGVMEDISSSIPDGGAMRRMPTKIPVEHFTFNEAGELTGRTHASGFSVPQLQLDEGEKFVDKQGRPHQFSTAIATDAGAVTLDGKHVDEPAHLQHSSAVSLDAEDSSKPPRGDEKDIYEMTDKQKQLQAAAVAERFLEEAALREGKHAKQRRLATKIPWEHMSEDGSIAHSSGFVPPTPIGSFGKPATVDELADKLDPAHHHQKAKRANEHGREDVSGARK